MPAVAADQVVFEQTIEGFLRAVRPRLTPACKARLLATGLDVDKRLLPAYGLPVWMECLRVAAEELWPQEPKERAFYLLGEAFIEGYKETFLGRAVLGVVRVLGPRRALLRATHNFRSGNNYTDAKVTEINPTHVELWMNEVGPYPSFTQGLIAAALRAAGAQPTITMTGHDGHACTYSCTWG